MTDDDIQNEGNNDEQDEQTDDCTPRRHSLRGRRSRRPGRSEGRPSPLPRSGGAEGRPHGRVLRRKGKRALRLRECAVARRCEVSAARLDILEILEILEQPDRRDGAVERRRELSFRRRQCAGRAPRRGWRCPCANSAGSRRGQASTMDPRLRMISAPTSGLFIV